MKGVQVKTINNNRGETLISVMAAVAIGAILAYSLTTMMSNVMVFQGGVQKDSSLEALMAEIAVLFNDQGDLCDITAGGVIQNPYVSGTIVNLPRISGGVKANAIIDGWTVTSVKFDTLSTGAIGVLNSNLQFQFQRATTGTGPRDKTRSIPLILETTAVGAGTVTRCYSRTGYLKLQEARASLTRLVDEIRDQLNHPEDLCALPRVVVKLSRQLQDPLRIR
jgi:hypothetical protein